MRPIERRLSAVEARIPKKDNGQAAVAEMLRWALTEELDAFRNLVERHHRGQASPGDDTLLDDLTARWNSRSDDPTIELDRIHDATRRWHRDPTRRLIGSYWVDWLASFDTRGESGTATEADWRQWRRLMAAVDLYIVRQAPLPEGVSWGPEGMPAALLKAAEADDAR